MQRRLGIFLALPARPICTSSTKVYCAAIKYRLRCWSSLTSSHHRQHQTVRVSKMSDSNFSYVFPTMKTTGAPAPISFSEFPRTMHPLVTAAQSKHMLFGVEEIHAGSEVPLHRHENTEEIIFVFKGAAKSLIYADGDDRPPQERDLTVGSTMFVPMKTKHRIINASSSESLWITYTFSPSNPITNYNHQASQQVMDKACAATTLI